MSKSVQSTSALTLRVLSYQNPELIERLKCKLSLTADQAEQLFLDTKRFLLLCGLRPGDDLVPTRAIDEAWHNFILYTGEYTEFCEDMFGRYIHHLPHSYFTPAPRDEDFARTLSLARHTFGQLGENWGSAMASSCSPQSGAKCGNRSKKPAQLLLSTPGS